MRYNLCTKTQMSAFNENKIYGAKMKQKLGEKARVERPLCKQASKRSLITRKAEGRGCESRRVQISKCYCVNKSKSNSEF